MELEGSFPISRPNADSCSFVQGSIHSWMKRHSHDIHRLGLEYQAAVCKMNAGGA